MRRAGLLVYFCLFQVCITAIAATMELAPPVLTNTPRLDTIVTTTTPLLSVFNSKGGESPLTYLFQIDDSPDFTSPDLITYMVPEGQRITAKQVENEDALQNLTWYYWRVKVIDQQGQESPWGSEAGGVVSRFFVDTFSDDQWQGLSRAEVSAISSSSGGETQNLVDYTEQGDTTFWEGFEQAATHTLTFTFNEVTEIRRIWLLGNTSKLAGRLSDYYWEYSEDGHDWLKIPEAEKRSSDSFRTLLDLPSAVAGKYLRITITGWHGPVPRIAEIVFFEPARTTPLAVPANPYLLIIGNRFDGTGQENVVKLINHSYPGLETLTIPYFQFDPSLLASLRPAPAAIILTGLGRQYETLPMFEYNGVFELIRNPLRPLLGICGGHQLLAMAYGYTSVNKIGRGVFVQSIEDIIAQECPPIRVSSPDLIFTGVPDPFYGVQLHSWQIDLTPPSYQVLATTPGLGIEVIRHKENLIYGTQFHGEINAPFNTARLVLLNFLDLALSAP